MSRYYVDGYNLLFSLTEELPVETSRLQLISALGQLVFAASLRVTIIFDNHSDLSTMKPSAEYHPYLEILFSPRGLCADAYILELLQGLKNPRLATVVTSDAPLAKRARSLGAETLPNIAFLKKLFKTKRTPEKKPEPEGKKELERLQKIFEDRYSSGNM